jgi:hypothetical protein
MAGCDGVACPECGERFSGEIESRFSIAAARPRSSASEAITATLPLPLDPGLIPLRLKCLKKIRQVRRTKCPHCGSTAAPYTKVVIPQAAWDIFVYLCALVITLPVCWLPLIALRERRMFCRECGMKMRRRTRR